MRWRKWHICALAKVYVESTTDHMRDVIPYRSRDESKLSKVNYELKRMGLVTIEDSCIFGHYSTDLTGEGKRVFESISIICVVAALESFDWFILVQYFIEKLSRAELAAYLVHEKEHYRRVALERYKELCLCDSYDYQTTT